MVQSVNPFIAHSFYWTINGINVRINEQLLKIKSLSTSSSPSAPSYFEYIRSPSTASSPSFHLCFVHHWAALFQTYLIQHAVRLRGETQREKHVSLPQNCLRGCRPRMKKLSGCQTAAVVSLRIIMVCKYQAEIFICTQELKSTNAPLARLSESDSHVYLSHADCIKIILWLSW